MGVSQSSRFDPIGVSYRRVGWRMRIERWYCSLQGCLLAPSTIVLAWILWVGGIGEDPDQKASGRLAR
jgi:hypothetical protein